MTEQRIIPKRALGEGRWDKVLKRKMVELSVSDDYDVAKHEWIATGNVWWEDVGDWDNPPNYVEMHPGKCLCGHPVTYHFEIHNTETDVRECVGSDHINSYLILRAIREETGLSDEMITDEMIEEWITVRVEALKKTAWWNVHGELFTEMFNEVKDFDLRCNVRKQGSYYDSTFREYRPVTHIRKRGEGRFGQPGYKMASIVWRWNHPDNQANQQRRKGYPNNKLYNDLMMFKFNIEEAKRRLQEQDDIDAERVATLKKHDDNQRKIREAQRQRRNKVVSEIEQVQHLPAFIEACEYYGLEPFVPEQGRNTWEENFLSDIKAKMIRGTILTDKQMTKLNSVFTGEKIVSQEATQKQKDYLIRLGFEGDIDNLTKDEASTEITILKTSKWGI